MNKLSVSILSIIFLSQNVYSQISAGSAGNSGGKPPGVGFTGGESSGNFNAGNSGGGIMQQNSGVPAAPPVAPPPAPVVQAPPSQPAYAGGAGNSGGRPSGVVYPGSDNASNLTAGNSGGIPEHIKAQQTAAPPAPPPAASPSPAPKAVVSSKAPVTQPAKVQNQAPKVQAAAPAQVQTKTSQPAAKPQVSQPAKTAAPKNVAPAKAQASTPKQNSTPAPKDSKPKPIAEPKAPSKPQENQTQAEDTQKETAKEKQDDKKSSTKEEKKSEDKKEEQKQNANEERKSNKKSYKVVVGAVPIVNYDKGDQVINQKKSKANSKEVKLNLNGTDYRGIKYQKWDLGAAVTVAVHEVNPTTLTPIAAAGVVPLWGKDAMINRRISNPDQIDDIKLPAFPISAKELMQDHYSTGDSITYQSKGTLTYFAGVGLGVGVGVGASHSRAILKDTWVTQIEILNNNVVNVKYTSTKKNNNSGINAGHLLLAVNANTFASKEKILNFSFNLRSVKAAQAFEKFIQGDATFAQQLAAQESSGVKSISKTDKSTEGTSSNLWVGIPILLNFTKTNTTSADKLVLNDSATKSVHQVDYKVHRFSSNSRAIFTHTSNESAFYAIRNVKKSSDGKSEKYYQGLFNWKFDTDIGGGKQKIRIALEDLRELTGLQKELTVDISKLPETDLGYTRIEFSMAISDEATDLLRQWGSSTVASNKFMESALNLWAQEIKKQCAQNIDPNCKDDAKEELRDELQDMSEALVKMHQSYAQNNYQQYLTDYADLGKTLLESPRVFQTFLKVIGKQPAAMKLVISGQSIEMLERNF